VMHRDQRFFTQPELFWPQRWLPTPTLPRGVYMPFGAGPRVCVGNHFAIAEAMLTLAVFLQSGQFELTRGPVLRLTPAITLRPSGPVPMRFVRR
ncbi:MAG: cytochrome P450, partial [Pseudomonadota bacterium]